MQGSGARCGGFPKSNVLGVFSLNLKKPFNSYKGDGKFAYACYSVEDSDYVFPVLKKLNEDRYRIRYDEGVQDEDTVDALRKHNIKKCDVFLVFMSQNFLLSPYCLNQLELAQNFGANMYIIYLDGAQTVDLASKLFSERVNSIRTDECSEDVILDVLSQLLDECQEPVREDEHVYTYDELLDEVYPGQKNESTGVFEATVNQDTEKIEKSAASAMAASKTAMTQKKNRKSKDFLNAILVVGVMIVIAIILYFFFGDQIHEALNPDEVVNFIPAFSKTIITFNLLS